MRTRHALTNKHLAFFSAHKNLVGGAGVKVVRPVGRSTLTPFPPARRNAPARTTPKKKTKRTQTLDRRTVGIGKRHFCSSSGLEQNLHWRSAVAANPNDLDRHHLHDDRAHHAQRLNYGGVTFCRNRRCRHLGAGKHAPRRISRQMQTSICTAGRSWERFQPPSSVALSVQSPRGSILIRITRAPTAPRNW